MSKRARLSTSAGHKATESDPSESFASREISAKASSSHVDTPAPPSTFKIIVGTYEKLLYGLEGHLKLEKDLPDQLSLSLNPIFIFPAHVACVRAVAASPQGGKWLATGSTDEIIKVWDLRRRKEVGGLIQHQGSITHLSFPSRSHLLSASEDGTLSLFSSRDWVLLRTLKGHKGKVNDVAMHPSGKLALSVGKDRTLRMWDMMRGKGAASTKLGKEGELVRWSVSGKLFVVQTGSALDVFRTDMTILDRIAHPSRIHSVKFWRHPQIPQQDILLVAAEDRFVTVYLIGDEQLPSRTIAKFGGHSNRVKALDTLDVSAAIKAGYTTTLMSTASSDGNIFVYDLAAIPAGSECSEEVPTFQPIASYDTKGSRLVCLTMADGEPAKPPSTVLGKRNVDGFMPYPRTLPTSTTSPRFRHLVMSSASSGPKRAHRPGGRDRRSEPIEVRMSKTLSYILRHGAAKEGLAIRSDGYVRVTDLLARPKLKELDLPGLFKIVEADQKQRYQLGAQASSSNEPIVPIPKTQVPDSTDVLWIRANQGHTLKVDDLELKPVAAPTEVQCAVHGTTLEAWQHIKSQGLSRMQRNHIHLASGRPGESGVISGMRVSSRVLIFIDIQAAMATGISFYLSSNGVILTTGDDSGFIPPEFFSSVEQRTDSGWEPIIVSGKSAELGTGEDI